MQWLIGWVVVVMEMLVAASTYLSRNPKVQELVASWLNKYGKYFAEETIYLWRWAQLRYPEGILAVNQRDFVKRVMEAGNQEIFDLLRSYGIALDRVNVIMTELENRVYLNLIDAVNRGLAPVARPQAPPGLPPWSFLQGLKGR